MSEEQTTTEQSKPAPTAETSKKSSKLSGLSPKTMGWRWFSVSAIGIVVLVMFLFGFYWSFEPDVFDVEQHAAKIAEQNNEEIVVGYTTTATIIRIAETLLDKQGGYLSNDVTPPSIFMDNMPSWEFGVLEQVRAFAKAMRNDISRSQTLGGENEDLALADPKFNVDNKSWMFPPAEGEYREGIEFLQAYLDNLADPNRQEAQFYSRADNLTDWLRVVSRRLGNLSQQLSASVGQDRTNIDLAGDADAQRSTPQQGSVRAKTPWLEIDNVFYEARGTAWALLHLLKAIEVDFKDVLERRNAAVSLRQIIRELESTQRMMWSPMVLNGSDFGFFANHSLVMSAYISRANAGIIELSDLLKRG